MKYPKKTMERIGMYKNRIKGSFILICLILLFTRTGVIFTQDIPQEPEKINVRGELRNMKSKNLQKKLPAISKLGKAGNKKATDGLIKELEDQKNSRIKVKILEALSYTGNKAVIPEITAVLKTDKSLAVKSAAVISLGSLRNDESISVLIDTFMDEEENIDVRLSALESLSRIRENKAVFDMLLEAAEDESPLIRKTAMGLLWQNFYSLKKKEIRPLLQKASKDEDKKVRNSAKQMLDFKAPRK
jgi:HEAT repeat protein